MVDVWEILERSRGYVPEIHQSAEIEMEFLIDFKNDVSKYISKNFGEYTRKDGLKRHKNTHLDYYTIFEKRIPIKPRKIAVSDVFEYPSNVEKSWCNLKRIIRDGGDINPYRSNTAEKQNPDSLLYEWNIFHLHFLVGKRSRKDGVPDNLLFCIFDDQMCYAIKIAGHGSFHMSDLFETIVRNWPHLVREIPGIPGTELTVSARAALREKNVNSFTAIKGKAYVPHKLTGFTSSGHPTNAYIHSVHDMRALTLIKDNSIEIEENTIQSLQNILQTTTSPPLLVFVALDIVLENGKMNFFLNVTTRDEHYTNITRNPYHIHCGDVVIG